MDVTQRVEKVHLQQLTLVDLYLFH